MCLIVCINVFVKKCILNGDSSIYCAARILCIESACYFQPAGGRLESCHKRLVDGHLSELLSRQSVIHAGVKSRVSIIMFKLRDRTQISLR